LEHKFTFYHGAILAIVANGDTVFAGCQDGYVKVLDLETKTLIRTIIVQEVDILLPFVSGSRLTGYHSQGVDILSMSRLNSDLFTCSANGWIKVRTDALRGMAILPATSVGLPPSTASLHGRHTKASSSHPSSQSGEMLLNLSLVAMIHKSRSGALGSIDHESYTHRAGSGLGCRSIHQV
jgi:hypothetical protein